MRTNRCGATLSWSRADTTCPIVQLSAAPMISMPCAIGLTRWIRSAASGRKLSTPRNAIVAQSRQATIAGKPRRARITPAGKRCRTAGPATRMPAPTASTTTTTDEWARPPSTAARPIAVRMASTSRRRSRGAASGLGARANSGGATTAAATTTSGMMPRNTQRHPNWSVTHPASAGASRLGRTHPADSHAYITGCRSAGTARRTAT